LVLANIPGSTTKVTTTFLGRKPKSGVPTGSLK
jgi:hypothetical protein